MKQTPIDRYIIDLLACQVSLHLMESTSVYGLELLVLEGTGGKALATDHRERKSNQESKLQAKLAHPVTNPIIIRSVVFLLSIGQEPTT